MLTLLIFDQWGTVIISNELKWPNSQVIGLVNTLVYHLFPLIDLMFIIIYIYILYILINDYKIFSKKIIIYIYISAVNRLKKLIVLITVMDCD